MSKPNLDYSTSAAEGHVHRSGGGALATAVADMMCWSHSPRADEVSKRLSGSTDMTLEDDFDNEASADLHMDDFPRRGSGTSSKGLKSFTDSKEPVARWSKDYRGSWDDDRGGRSRSNPPSRQRPSESEGVMAAAAGGKELAALQSQAQEIERDIRNLKAKLATDNGSKRAERREDVKILTEILADIRAQETQKKREISAAMGTARDVKESRLQRAKEQKRREIKREMEFNA